MQCYCTDQTEPPLLGFFTGALSPFCFRCATLGSRFLWGCICGLTPDLGCVDLLTHRAAQPQSLLTRFRLDASGSKEWEERAVALGTVLDRDQAQVSIQRVIQIQWWFLLIFNMYRVITDELLITSIHYIITYTEETWLKLRFKADLYTAVWHSEKSWVSTNIVHGEWQITSILCF